MALVFVSLIVEGSDPAIPGTSYGSVHVTTPPVAPQPHTLSASGSKKMQTLNVKVIQATMKCLSSGKCEFVHLGQTFVDVAESKANVNCIRDVVQKRWGCKYVFVTGDGLEIEDSSGTQGAMCNIVCKQIWAGLEFTLYTVVKRADIAFEMVWAFLLICLAVLDEDVSFVTLIFFHYSKSGK